MNQRPKKKMDSAIEKSYFCFTSFIDYLKELSGYIQLLRE